MHLPEKPKMNRSDIFYFDLETQLSADEVGGWDMAHEMKLSIAVGLFGGTDDFLVYNEQNIHTKFVTDVQQAKIVVTFNGIGFDMKVLTKYIEPHFLYNLPHFDMLVKIYNTLGHRLSLNALAEHNLGITKSGSGLEALQWWKTGDTHKIVEYCKRDVEITRQIFRKGCTEGGLAYVDRKGWDKSVDTKHWANETRLLLNK